MTEPTYADPYTRIAWLHEQLAAAEVREAQLSEALNVITPERLEALALWLDIDDERSARAGDEVQADLRRMARLARAALAVQPPDTREPEEVNEPGSTTSRLAESSLVRNESMSASEAVSRPGSLTSPAGGAPGGVDVPKCPWCYWGFDSYEPGCAQCSSGGVANARNAWRLAHFPGGVARSGGAE